MALAVERAWPDVALEGLVITRYAHGAPTQRIRVVEAGHPVPDDAGEAAARDIMQLVSSLQRDDLLLALISGGGSSLLSLPVPEVSMASLKSVTTHVASQRRADRRDEHCAQALVANRWRTACRGCDEAWRACVALMISDVTGDAPTDIASGPCAADPSTYADAIAVLLRWNVEAPDDVSAWLQRGANGYVSTKRQNRAIRCLGKSKIE